MLTSAISEIQPIVCVHCGLNLRFHLIPLVYYQNVYIHIKECFSAGKHSFIGIILRLKTDSKPKVVGTH